RLARGEQDRADRADRGRFGRRRDTAEDRAKHREDERKWCDEHFGELAHQRRAAWRLAVGLERRCGLWIEQRDTDDVDQIERDECESGQERAREQVAHGQRARRETALREL